MTHDWWEGKDKLPNPEKNTGIPVADLYCLTVFHIFVVEFDYQS